MMVQYYHKTHMYMYSLCAICVFKPLNSKTSKGRMNPFLIKRIEFWERKAAKHPPSMTLTIRGPILYRSKAAPASKPASRPASRPSSKASLRSTTRPAPQTQPRK